MKKNMKKLYIPILLFICISLGAVAQDKSSQELQGDKYAFIFSYTEAIESYNRAKQLTTEGQRMLAEAYRNMNLNIESEAAYAKLIGSGDAGVLPEDYFNYAKVLEGNGNYDLALENMDKFNALKPTDLRAKNYVANKSQLDKWMKDDGKYKVQHLTINTDADDFGTCYYTDKIVFSSSRSTPKMIKRTDNWHDMPYLDMYVASVEDGQLKDPEIFDKRLDSKLHDGPASFTSDGLFMAFSTNNFQNKIKDKAVQLEIYFSTYKDGEWSKQEPFFLNSPDYSVAQPFLTSGGKVMYFVSDMPGGYGGADIYRITKDALAGWGMPENLGEKINTEGDEMFPFFEEKKATMFFSSNGRFGLGGLDVFMCASNGSEFGRVYNAGTPINTRYDDFALVTDSTRSKGYFSSNRAEGSGSDDIYSVDIFRIEIGKKLEGIAKDKNGVAVPSTFITLLDDKDHMVDTATTKSDGAFVFLVDSDKNYKLAAVKADYNDGFTMVNTSGTEFIVTADVILLQKELVKETLKEQIKVGADLGKILKFNPDRIFFDLNKFDIRADAKEELAYIIKVMNDHPTMVVESRSYTDCRASDKYNQKLSEKRAKACADYIKKRITNPERITSKGYGETGLMNACACEGKVLSDCTDAEHQKNRRAEFIIVQE